MRQTVMVVLVVGAAMQSGLSAPQPKDDGYRGIWYYNQATKDEYKYGFWIHRRLLSSIP